MTIKSPYVYHNIMWRSLCFVEQYTAKFLLTFRHFYHLWKIYKNEELTKFSSEEAKLIEFWPLDNLNLF